MLKSDTAQFKLVHLETLYHKLSLEHTISKPFRVQVREREPASTAEQNNSEQRNTSCTSYFHVSGLATRTFKIFSIQYAGQ